jgi:uncharacterized protein (TIGR04255 family)
VEEVPLRDSPLVGVIAQVRFPAVMSIQPDSSFVAPFQEALRKDYPVLRQERQLQVLIGPSGASPHDAGVILRFEQQDPDAWQVTLAPTFVSLFAKRYTRRSDLLSRLTVVLHALDSWLDPKVCDRVGVRYIDRVTGERLAQLAKMVRSEVLGIKGVPTDGGVEVVHTLADALFRLSTMRQSRRVGRFCCRQARPTTRASSLRVSNRGCSISITTRPSLGIKSPRRGVSP